MSGVERPAFRELDREASDAVLAAHHVGRIVYSFRGRVDIEPISYVYADGWIHGRTAPGTKLTTLRHHPWVAFEVDEAEGPFDWRSVVVHGTFYHRAADGPPSERETFQRALAALRGSMPETLTATDPVPSRTVVFGIFADDVTGRAATSSRRDSS